MASSASPCTMLLVDDDELLLSAMARAARAPVRLLTARSSRETREIAASTHLDIAMVDKRLAGESGLDVVRWLRAHQPHLAITLVTGDLDAETIADALLVGADDCLEKPFRLAQVRDRLEQRATARAESGDVLTLAQIEWAHIQRVLGMCGGNRALAAKILGISTSKLDSKLDKGRPR